MIINTEPPWKDLRFLLLLAAMLAIAVFVFPLAVRFPLLDPDEGLHASIAQEMVESGDWIVPHFLGEPFLDKPILYFWFQAASLKIFGMSEMAVRLPGLLLGLLGAITTGIVGGKMFGRTTGLVACIFYSTMILPVALAQAAAHDVALVPCVNLAILLFWQSDRARTWKSSTGYGLAIGVILGLAILAKGLLGVALVGVTYGSYLLLTRQLTLAACYRGVVSLVVAAAVASIWYLAVEWREPGYLNYYFIDRHVLGFATATQTHGDAPWWLYLPLLLGGGLPWIGYLPITIKELRSISEPRELNSEPRGLSPRLETANSTTLPGEGINSSARLSAPRPARLLWCWLIVCTLLLTLARSKLITYIWPVFPSVAILAAITWSRLIDGTISQAAKQAFRKNFFMSSFAGPLVLPIAVLVLQKIFGIRFDWPIWTATILAALSTLVPLWFLRRSKWRGLLTAATVSTAFQFLVIISLILPIVAPFYTEKQLAEHFNRTSDRLPNRIYFVEERISSFVFYLNPTLRASIADKQLQQIRRPKDGSKLTLDLQPGEVIVIPEKKVRRAKEYLDLTGKTVHEAGRHLLMQEEE